jgi:hypothetical protein
MLNQKLHDECYTKWVELNESSNSGDHEWFTIQELVEDAAEFKSFIASIREKYVQVSKHK